MPAYPSQRTKLKPDRDYALYYNGPDGTYVTYYSTDVPDRTIHGEEAKKAFGSLSRSWDQVKGGGSPEGMVYLFERLK